MASRERLHRLLANELGELCRRIPVALVIEDLHHADPASLELLLSLEQSFGPDAPSDRGRLLVVGSYRPKEASESLAALTERVLSRSQGAHLALSGLAEHDMHDYLVASGLTSPSRERIEEMARASSGNPFLMREIARLLLTQGDLDSAQSPARLASTADLPRSSRLDDWVADRLETLTPSCIRALSIFAVGGAELALGRFQELLEALGDAPQRALDEALRTGLVSLHRGRIRFGHEIVREVLARRLEPGERRALHLRIARAWTDARHKDPNFREGAIAHHLFAAGALADSDELVHFAEKGAQRATARFAWSEAILLLGYALERVQEPRHRARLHYEIACLHFSRFDAIPCLHHFEQAQRIHRATGDELSLARSLAATLRAQIWLGEEDLRVTTSTPREVRQALETLDVGEIHLRGALLCALADYERYCGRPGRAEELATTALALPLHEGDGVLRSDIAFTLGSAQHSNLHLREGLSSWRDGAAAAESAGDLAAVARCRQRVQLSRFCLGDIAAYEQEESDRTMLEDLGHAPGDASLAHSVELGLALHRGDWSRVEQHASIAHELARRSRHSWSLLVVAYACAGAHATRGDGVGARKALAWTRQPGLGFAASHRASFLDQAYHWLVDLFIGDPVGLTARERESLLAEIEHEDRNETAFQLTSACFAVEVADHLRDAELAAVALERIASAEKEGWMLMLGWPHFIPRLKGVAATLIGDLDLGERSFQRAMELAERLQFPVELGRSRLDHAQMLALRDAPGDRDQARRLAARARVELQMCSRSLFARRADKLTAYLGPPSDTAAGHRLRTASLSPQRVSRRVGAEG